MKKMAVSPSLKNGKKMMSDSDDFRKKNRAWLEENCPPEMREPMASKNELCWGGREWVFFSEAQRKWLEVMAMRGWTAPEWPREYGGGGLSKQEAKILRRELLRINARPPLVSFGIWMLGPALLKFGSEDQKKEYLPKIVRGEVRWCQGYSEPGAGSDLANIQTKAEDKGDHWLVNGQKIWTSFADQADWIFCLVRSEPDESKHTGISFLLFDMSSSGVSTKPIQLISGNSPFCETFFDNVKVPKENLVGERGKGWTIAKYLLTHEREMIGAMGLTEGQKTVAETAIETIGVEKGVLKNTMLRFEVARHEINVEAFKLTMERVKAETKAGQGSGATSAMLKYYGTELNKDRLELLMEIGGTANLEWEGTNADDSQLAKEWLRSRANSIEGGTTEIQLNIISKHILGLPSK